MNNKYRDANNKVLSKYSDSLTQWLSDGKTLSSWCTINGISKNAVRKWILSDDEFAREVSLARDVGLETMAEECLTIIDQEPELTGKRGRDAAFVAWQRARVETRLRLLAVWDPKKYHPRFIHDHHGQMTLQVTTGVHRAAEKAVETRSLARNDMETLPALDLSDDMYDAEDIKEAECEVIPEKNSDG